MRAVLDTNILVSAFNFPGGTPESVFRLVVEGQLQLITSQPLLLELGRVLTNKFGWKTPLAEETIGQLARLAKVVAPMKRVHEISADPSDNRVLEAALEGSAETIVSGDRHLLRLREWKGIRIVDAATFLLLGVLRRELSQMVEFVGPPIRADRR